MATIENISMALITSNPYQPRKEFDGEGIKELSVSIQKNGLIQPIVVRPFNGYYQIITGERRFKACQLLDWIKIPCIIQEATDSEMATMALIENLQREDLSPIEEGQAYKQLLEMTKETQATLAEQLGKTQSSIANKMRLLSLSEPVQEALNNRVITERHGRAMLHLNAEQQEEILEKVMVKGLNVKETEKLIENTFVKKHNDNDRIKCFGVSTRIAVNTIRQAVKNLQKVNMDIQSIEEDGEEEYTITIKIKK